MSISSNPMRKLPFYYGWVNVVLAALAMVATLPGRTHGLGLITEPLLADLDIQRVQFAQLNLWATLLGAAACLPIGKWIDRYGTRRMLTVVAIGLGLVVLVMSGITQEGAQATATFLADDWPGIHLEPATLLLLFLFVTVTLTRALGQSALSVVSLTMVGKWFKHRLGLAMGVFSILMGLGFAAAFPLVGKVLGNNAAANWRLAWAGIGWCLLLGVAPLGTLLVRRGPEACGLAVDGGSAPDCQELTVASTGFTLRQALLTPAFWIFALATSLYGLISSGISLFNQSILQERGFDAQVYYQLLSLTTLVFLVTNLLGGWLATRWSIGLLLALAMGVLTASLVGLPHVHTYVQVILFGVAYASAGGIITVVFFTVWGQVFGRLHLGVIQGAAQMITVLASAVGPLLLAECKERTGSYTLMFYSLALVVALLGLAAWWVPIPRLPESAGHNLDLPSEALTQGALEHAGNP